MYSIQGIETRHPSFSWSTLVVEDTESRCGIDSGTVIGKRSLTWWRMLLRDLHLKDEAKQRCRKWRWDGWMCWASRKSYQLTPGHDAASQDGILVFPIPIEPGLDVGTPQPRHHAGSRRFTPSSVALFGRLKSSSLNYTSANVHMTSCGARVEPP